MKESWKKNLLTNPDFGGYAQRHMSICGSSLKPSVQRFSPLACHKLELKPALVYGRTFSITVYEKSVWANMLTHI